MIYEIQEIPEKAKLCYQKNKDIILPKNVPYLGMGSSYFAPLTLKYLGLNIYPETASEYYHYLSGNKNYPVAVLLSQSGYSSETLWNIEKFDEYVAIVNDVKSPLAENEKVNKVIPMYAGEEKYSSTKTYVNTLITLYQGLGIDTGAAIEVLSRQMDKYNNWGEKQAELINKAYQSKKIKGLYLLGNGPNLATAGQAALILTETIKIPVIPHSVSQYDHGPKESANDTIVLVINTNGEEKSRTESLIQKIERAGAMTVLYHEYNLDEYLSPFSSIIPFNFLAYYLAQQFDIKDTFAVGGKITTV